jgi:NTE family protein
VSEGSGPEAIPDRAAQDLSPVHYHPHERGEPAPRERVGLALSGGGYRAMLFHVGALWRLNQAGILGTVDLVSSVSGGSIAGGVLATGWKRLSEAEFSEDAFREVVVDRVRDFARRGVAWPSVLEGLLLPGSINAKLERRYRRLFGDAQLHDLPGHPVFIFNATNLHSGELWRFTRESMGDRRVGRIKRPKVAVAAAVAASSAFPPFLSPRRLRLSEDMYEPVRDHKGIDLHEPPYTTKPVLTDGGVYDNLGLEHPWKRCQTVLVSDGGAHLKTPRRIPSFWATQSTRASMVIDNQVRSLRKLQLIGGFKTHLRRGTYWGIRSHVEDFPLSDVLPCDQAATESLASIHTGLSRLEGPRQERLINWGYAIADTAIRSWVDRRQPRGEFPYPRGV